MPSEESLITMVGSYALPDKDMPFLNSMNTSDVWAEKDHSFDQIRSAMRQVLSSWEINTEHLIPELTPISSQGGAGSCVANAWCDAMEMLLGIRFGKDNVVQLSRRFLYWMSRMMHSATDVDEGTFLRAAAHQLRVMGCILEDDMPYSDRTSLIVGKKASPKLEHYTMASNNRLNGFYRLHSDGEQMLNELEIAIRTNHPVIFAVPVSKRFQQTRSMSIFDAPSKIDWAGWHCMIITGVKFANGVRHWFVRNSWGKRWGGDGHCWMKDDYIKLNQDMWVGTLMKRLI